MIYEYSDKMKKIPLSEIDPSCITVGLITIEELVQNNQLFGFSEAAIAECQNKSFGFRGSVDNFEDYSFGMLHIIDIGNIFGERDRIGFFIKKNLFLLVDAEDKDDSTSAIFETAMQQIKYPQITIEKLIYAFLSKLLNKDYKLLEKMEFDLASLEDGMDTRTNKIKFNAELLLMKKKFLLVRNYYEQLIDISEELRENDNNLFEEENLRYFKMFSDKVTRLANNVNYMHESLVQLREAYEASIDINLNNIMKLFTVITTIFMPLTLITGWYGMNFDSMPELTWKFGYICVIILSLAVVILCLWLFKKKKFL